MAHDVAWNIIHYLPAPLGVQNANPPKFDVTALASTDSTLIATVMNGTGLAGVRTVISWNLGGTWDPVRTVEALEGLVRAEAAAVDDAIIVVTLTRDFCLYC